MVTTPDLTDLIAQNAPQYLGGVNPIGVIEPFNPIQRQALLRQAGGAPAMGFMKRAQAASEAQAAGMPTGADIAGDFARGRDLLGRGTSAVSGEDISQYMNPYMEEVLQSTIDRINQEGAVRASNLRGRAAPGQRSFGTSSQGVQQGIEGRGLMDTIADTTSNLKFGGYQSALQQANTQRQREIEGSRLATGGAVSGMSSLGNVLQNAISGNIANQRNFAQNVAGPLAAGTAIQQQNQATLDVLRPQIEQRTGFNAANLSNLGTYLNQIPNSGTGAVAGRPDTLSRLGGAGMALTSLAGAYDQGDGGDQFPQGAPIPTRRPF